jgi:alpha-galactosidase
MADICAGFIKRWDFDGAKYDLFNCVPNNRCENPEHKHDVSSMVEGLELTLKQIDDKCRALKPDYIVELKQNYATPFLSRYGSMTRAGDTPYNTEGNFLRTLYVQGYSPFSINDYQTITNDDKPEDAACVVLKMMAAGIPTYSIDFSRLNKDNKKVIARYNNWYLENLKAFMNYRIPLDGENNIFKLPAGEQDFYFLVNDGGPIKLGRGGTVLNGTYARDLFIEVPEGRSATVIAYDCFGKKKGRRRTLKGAGFKHVEMQPGGMVTVQV